MMTSVTAYDQYFSCYFQLDTDAFTVNSPPKGKEISEYQLWPVFYTNHCMT